MPDIRITIPYIMHVVPEWYDTTVLSGNGTLEEQICAYEKDRAEKNSIYVADLKHETITVEFIPELLRAWCGDPKLHSKHKFVVEVLDDKFMTTQEYWLMCQGKPIVDRGDEELNINYELKEEEDIAAARQHEYMNSCVHCTSKTCDGSCPQSDADQPNSED